MRVIRPKTRQDEYTLPQITLPVGYGGQSAHKQKPRCKTGAEQVYALKPARTKGRGQITESPLQYSITVLKSEILDNEHDERKHKPDNQQRTR